MLNDNMQEEPGCKQNQDSVNAQNAGESTSAINCMHFIELRFNMSTKEPEIPLCW